MDNIITLVPKKEEEGESLLESYDDMMNTIRNGDETQVGLVDMQDTFDGAIVITINKSEDNSIVTPTLWYVNQSKLELISILRLCEHSVLMGSQSK